MLTTWGLHGSSAMGDIRQFPTEVVDRVARTAGAIVKVLELSDLDPPEDHIAALLLVQTAIQQAVAKEAGPLELRRVLHEAIKKKNRYDVKWAYRINVPPLGQVHPIKGENDV